MSRRKPRFSASSRRSLVRIMASMRSDMTLNGRACRIDSRDLLKLNRRLDSRNLLVQPLLPPTEVNVRPKSRQLLPERFYLGLSASVAFRQVRQRAGIER